MPVVGVQAYGPNPPLSELRFTTHCGHWETMPHHHRPWVVIYELCQFTRSTSFLDRFAYRVQHLREPWQIAGVKLH